MTSKRRVVVTGFGCVSPLGLTASALWDGLMGCRSGIGPITRFPANDHATKIAGEVKDFDPEKWIPKREVRQMDRFIQFAVAAADEAVKDSGIVIDEKNADRVGTLVGVGLGGLETLEVNRDLLVQKGPRRLSPYFIPSLISNLAPGQISMRHHAKGPSLTTTSACSSAAHAIGEATRWIQRGDADAMITGGAEATITPLGIAGFNALKALSTRNDAPQAASRPFDKDRDGFVMAEGAGMLILEDLESAKARGARIYAEVTGYGATADAFHMTQPAPGAEGAVRCMRLCVNDAGVNPQDVQHINAHGTSTPINDPLETMAIKVCFGDHARKLAISSTKSMTGHLLGAAGAIEGIASILAIVHQVAPPTINLDTPDPECDLDYVPREPRPMHIENVLSNSLGFGGTNAALLFSKFKG
ncbi:MAG: beta-ketoacyl-ACP synthase II [Deltaproteobacteria bacterium]|nr:beta-ketoacyl-ACP synthase II [Deltaproteobacteria bacterium]